MTIDKIKSAQEKSKTKYSTEKNKNEMLLQNKLYWDWKKTVKDCIMDCIYPKGYEC